MDIDEEAFRAGAVSARLYGYMPVPYAPDLTQNMKAGGVSGNREVLCSIAAEIAGRMEAGRLYILGPGTTTRAVMEALHLPKTLLGVDLVRDGAVIAADATEGVSCGRWPEAAPEQSSSPPLAARGIFSGAATSRSGHAWCGRWASTGSLSPRRRKSSRPCATAPFMSIPAIPRSTVRSPAGAA